MENQESGALHTFGQFIGALEDGDLSNELTEKTREISAALTNHMLEHGGKPKAKLKLEIDFKADQGIIEVIAKVDATLPKGPRLRTMMWQTPSNYFTPQNPKQMALFGGPKAVPDNEAAPRVVDGGS